MTAPTLDHHELAILKEDLGPAAVLVLKKFLQILPDRLSTLTQSIQDNDPKSIRQAAHHLKGGARQVGAMRLIEIAEQIELTTDHSSRSSLFATLKQEVEQLVVLLEDEIKQLSTAT